MPSIRLATTPIVRASRALHAVNALVAAPHRVLAAVAGPSLAPQLTPRLPTPPALAALLGGLRGRIVVANPCATARLPQAIARLARSALHRALVPQAPDSEMSEQRQGLTLEDARDVTDRRRLAELRAALPEAWGEIFDGTPAPCVAMALYEPRAPVARFAQHASLPSAPEPPPLIATPSFRIALVVGRDAEPPAWEAIDAAVAGAPAVAWPPATEFAPWFLQRVLVSDAVAAAAMDATTLSRWAAVTGRAGRGSTDHYWFAETWERFRESPRVVGYVTPAEIGRSRGRGTPRTFGGDVPYGPGPYTGSSLAVALTPDAERGLCVPPGYCLLTCIGTLEITLVRV